jgi:hypothetical protein
LVLIASGDDVTFRLAPCVFPSPLFPTASTLQQQEPLLETIKTVLTAHWAGENPALLTDILQQSV